ncbi:hypothetical protein N7495_002518 [Penicillium taxi]|uniref:uncharacterized protein n=1 Tax=Penicillium taxi TaxID=168475 RepID=UPI00254503C2|nr:uncharacterized protein N7495_002518 [Penicillium taxi]KAJ5901990.1 hypothetical protein N7495_002518 [Penicillium taxi]
MPIIKNFTLPSSAKKLILPNGPESKLFVAFIASPDPITKQPWCPDVRAVLPYLSKAFAGGDTPTVALVEVGQKPEWKDPQNDYRTIWGIKGIPSLVRYQQVDGEVTETGRILDDEILKPGGSEKLYAFIS